MHQDYDGQGGRQRKLTRRRMLLVSGAGLSALVLGVVHPLKISAQTPKPSLSSEDILAIQQLYSRYFYALDALVGGDTAASWADTFTPDGTFSLVSANGKVIVQATGTQGLIHTYGTFPSVQTTRHWHNNFTIEADVGGAKGGCYILAMNVYSMPATIMRTGVYKDQLVNIRRSWKFQSRILTLDPNIPQPWVGV